MSYDLHVYTCLDPAAALARLADEGELQREGESFSIAGGGWQAVFGPADRVESEDVPPDVMRELPGIAYLTEINIEGGAPDSAHTRTLRAARKLAKEARGVVVDPQEGTVETPRGNKRVDFATAGEQPQSLLTISWWFQDADAFARDGVGRVLDAMALHAPEALPKRYGLWEPPQFKFAETGREHLQSFLTEHLREPTVWYPSKLFTHAHLAVPPKVGASPQGYRCCLLKLEADARVLDAPGWPLALLRLWTAVAQAVTPLFAEIRAGESPIRSWFWTGIPRELSYAAMIGPPYTQLWPQFLAGAQEIAPGLFALETLDARKPLELTPPKDIAQPKQPPRPSESVGFSLAKLRALINAPIVAYPKVWPFASPFAPVER